MLREAAFSVVKGMVVGSNCRHDEGVKKREGREGQRNRNASSWCVNQNEER